ncbi:MAG: ArsR/SmtB family transcription factor [Polyangiaceae bacterium]
MNAAASEQLDAVFGALADPTRRAILTRLSRGEATVKELAEPFAMSQPAISKHLKLLERAGLVRVGQDAQRRPRRLVVEPLTEARACIERYRVEWEQHFKRLDGLLEELQRGPAQRRPKPKRVKQRSHLKQKK